MTSKAGIFSQFVSERWDDRSEKWFKTSCMWIISGVPDLSLQLWTQRKIKFIYPFRYMLRNGVWLPAHKIRASQPTYKYQPKCLTFCVCPCHQVVPYIRSCPFLHFQVVWRCSPPPLDDIRTAVLKASRPNDLRELARQWMIALYKTWPSSNQTGTGCILGTQ